MIFNLKFIAIAALGSYLAGSVSGLWIANKWHNYDAMRAAITSLKDANKRYRDAVGISKDLDKSTSDVELDNEEIMSAIAAKIEEAAKKKGIANACKSEDTTPPKSGPIVVTVDECIPASILRAIGDLK